MSLRDYMKERKEIACGDGIASDSKAKCIERLRDYRHMQEVIGNLPTKKALNRYIREKIKQQYAWINSVGFAELEPDPSMSQTIASAINKCNDLLMTGGIEAGREWCKQLYMQHESEREKLGIKNPSQRQKMRIAVELGRYYLHRNYGCKRANSMLMKKSHKYKIPSDQKPLSRHALKKKTSTRKAMDNSVQASSLTDSLNRTTLDQSELNRS